MADELGKTVPVTMTVVLYAGILMAIGVLAIGALGYLWRGKARGKLLLAFTMVGISVPGFYLGTAFLDVFAVKLGWISVSGQISASGLMFISFGQLLLWANANRLFGTGDGRRLCPVCQMPGPQ